MWGNFMIIDEFDVDGGYKLYLRFNCVTTAPIYTSSPGLFYPWNWAT